MSKLRIAAAAALLVMAIPVFAQYTPQSVPPSSVQNDQAKANMQAADALSNPNVHWTEKERAAIYYQAPYIRPNDMWEIDHMFREMDSNDQRVIFDAITNSIQANAGDYYQRRAAEEAYWQNLYANPSSMTTVTANPNGTTSVTTTTTTTTTPPVVVTTPPTISTPTASYTPPLANSDEVRQQSMIGAGMAVGHAMDTYAAWELLQRDLNAQDRTTFRRAWDGMTGSQQDALVDIVRQSNYYFTARSNGYYYYYNP
jgi:hypothetical protein